MSISMNSNPVCLQFWLTYASRLTNVDRKVSLGPAEWSNSWLCTQIPHHERAAYLPKSTLRVLVPP